MGVTETITAATTAIASSAAAVARSAISESEEQDPNAALQKLTLDDDIARAFREPLRQMGFALSDEVVRGEFGDSSTLTVTTIYGIRTILILVPDWILDNDTRKNCAAFDYLSHQFPSGSHVYVIARKLESIALTFETIMNEWRTKNGIEANYLPWRNVKRLMDNYEHNTAGQLVSAMLKLPAGPTSAPERDMSAPSPKEIEIIVGIMSIKARDPFIREPQEFFRALLQAADLSLQGTWSNDAEVDARNLVKWSISVCQKYPIDHPRQGEPTLGWLLKALLERNLSPEDDQATVRIILDHGLIRDPDTLKRLQRRHPNVS